jgi:hypothetical protein
MNILLRNRPWLPLACLLAVLTPGLLCGQGKPENLRRQVKAWLDKNYLNKYPETSAKVRQQVDKDLDDGNDFAFTFGPGVMSSGKAYQVHVFAGQFHTFPLTIPQVKQVLSGPDRVDYAGGKRGYKIETARVSLDQLRVDNGNNLDPAKKLTGQVSYQVRQKPDSKIAIRLTYRWEGSTYQLFDHRADGLPNDKGTLTFSVGPMADDNDKDRPKLVGPLVVFVDLCTIAEEPSPELGGVKIPTVKVLSNSVPALLDVAAR